MDEKTTGKNTREKERLNKQTPFGEPTKELEPRFGHGLTLLYGTEVLHRFG